MQARSRPWHKIERVTAAVGIFCAVLLVFLQIHVQQLAEETELGEFLDRFGDAIAQGKTNIEAVADLEVIVLSAEGIDRAGVHGELRCEKARKANANRKIPRSRARLVRGGEKF